MNVRRAKADSSQRPTSRASDEAGAALPWSRGWRIGASVLILYHLAAVIVPPLSFATRGNPNQPSSPAIYPLVRLVQVYMDAAFLNHGYAFFAPNPPGATALLRYRVEFEDGREPVTGELPDVEDQFPRLYYHRHFMLSEQLSARETPPEPPPGSGPLEISQWRQGGSRYRLAWNAFENHLLKKYGGSKVTMEFYDHRPPGIGESLEGIPLDDPSLYRARSERWRLEPMP